MGNNVSALSLLVVFRARIEKITIVSKQPQRANDEITAKKGKKRVLFLIGSRLSWL
jgi:hypothetical protein